MDKGSIRWHVEGGGRAVDGGVACSIGQQTWMPFSGLFINVRRPMGDSVPGQGTVWLSITARHALLGEDGDGDSGEGRGGEFFMLVCFY